jgi:tetratricopeptide (TPR) repeat protein
MQEQNSPKSMADELRLKPAQTASLMQLGDLYYRNGRMREAKDILEGLRLLDPENPYAYAILGSIYQQEMNYEDAIDSYSKALELQNNDIYTLTNRGECYLNLGKLEEAAADWRAAMFLDPEQKNPGANRARILSALTLEGLKLASEQGINAVFEAKHRLDKQLADSHI